MSDTTPQLVTPREIRRELRLSRRGFIDFLNRYPQVRTAIEVRLSARAFRYRIDLLHTWIRQQGTDPETALTALLDAKAREDRKREAECAAKIQHTSNTAAASRGPWQTERNPT
jgi:hypothetical protein